MYYTSENGYFIEKENGIIPGCEWSDNYGNEFRAIVFMFNFNSLQYGQSIEYIYCVESRGVGRSTWINERNVSVEISNSMYLNTITGGLYTYEEASEDGILKQGYIGQLDYFINAIGKGIPEPVAIYDLMIKEIKRREGLNIA